MIDKFLGALFLSRDIAHREHLKTKSYAQHKALGHFYEDIVDLVDSLAETYQGRNGIIENIPIFNELKGGNKGTSAEKLKTILDYIEAERYNAVDKEETAMQNIIDEIVALFLTTLYKLNNLK